MARTPDGKLSPALFKPGPRTPGPGASGLPLKEGLLRSLAGPASSAGHATNMGRGGMSSCGLGAGLWGHSSAVGDQEQPVFVLIHEHTLAAGLLWEGLGRLVFLRSWQPRFVHKLGGTVLNLIVPHVSIHTGAQPSDACLVTDAAGHPLLCVLLKSTKTLLAFGLPQ